MVGQDRKGAQSPAARTPRNGKTGRTPTGQERADGDSLPPAGPHADPELTDRSKTPGTGALSDPEGEESVEPGSG